MKSKLDLKQLICYQVETKRDRNRSARLQSDPRRLPRSHRMCPVCSKMVTKWFQDAFRRIQWASSDPKMILRAPQMTQTQSKMTPRAAMMDQDAPQKCPWGIPNGWKLKNMSFSKNVVSPCVFQWKVLPERQEMMGKVPETSEDCFEWNVLALGQVLEVLTAMKGGWGTPTFLQLAEPDPHIWLLVTSLIS